MKHLTLLLGLFLLAVSGCSTLPRDVEGRRLVYEQRLSRLEFPTTRQRLYKSLHPAAPPHRRDSFTGSFMTGDESYRLDADFVVELSVIYKAAVGAADFLNPTRGLGSQVRAILDTTQSIENMYSSGSANHPGDIVQKARVVRRPLREY
ncbi:MAG TPA: hypothetical protein VGE39_11105 [Prosthecobacter sp.]